MSDNSEIKWEYHVLPVDQLNSQLYGLGDEGWNLAGFHGDDTYFKRRKAHYVILNLISGRETFTFLRLLFTSAH